jgi:hypothetical protein
LFRPPQNREIFCFTSAAHQNWNPGNFNHAMVIKRVISRIGLANPAGMTKALMAIVHDGSTAEEARRFLSAKGSES